MPYCAFDIECRTDKSLISGIFIDPPAKLDVDGKPIEEDAVEASERAYQLYRDELAVKTANLNPFMPLALHVPIAIAFATVNDDFTLTKVTSIEAESEGDLVKQFWKRAENYPGTFVSFYGRSYDFPVLELAAFRHGVSIPNWFDSGGRHRYKHDKHLDVCDYLSNYGAVRIAGGLSVLSAMLGMPPKGGIDGGAVQTMFEAGKLKEIEAYNRNDCRRLYWVFLRMALMRGQIDEKVYFDRMTAAMPMLELE